MTKQMMIPLLAILGIGLGCLSAEAQETDQERIQGTWEIVSMTSSGEADDDQVGNHVLFEGSRLFPKAEGAEGTEGTEVSFELEESAMPSHFKMRVSFDLGEDEGAPITMSMLGIYELDGDTLTLCLTEQGDENRPTEFESPADSDLILIHFKRVVEEE